MNTAPPPTISEISPSDAQLAPQQSCTRVAYLFTDIDASTERWERAPKAMAEAVARHDALVRAIIERHGGLIKDRAGDGFFATFTGGAPLACAIEIQFQLQRTDWTSVGGLDVRIGVHSALSDPASGTDQVDVNRAARIAASGWGGQTVLSEEALNAHPLPSQASVKDLGLCRLKGLEAPLHLFSLHHPGVRGHDFPPPRALLYQARTIPLDRTPIYGRDGEIRDILERLNNGARFISITGPGGQGKTRLALAVAAAASGALPVYLCTLAEDDAPGDAMMALARTLNVAGPLPPQRAVAAFLRDQRALVVLDNADNLSGRCAFILELLQHCPQMLCLTTSRAPLGEGEVLRLQGLAAPSSAAEMRDVASARLFEAVARTRRPHFKLREDDFTTFRAICATIGGSPLALHLLGEWVGALTLAEVQAKLSDDFSFLRELGDASLRAGLSRAMGGSWSLLTPHERSILARVCVFRSNFDARAAEFVADATPADLLSLERKALLEQADERRFSMHPFVREYAHAQLGEEGAKIANALHAEYFLALLRRTFSDAKGETQTQALSSLDQDFDNIAKAWRTQIRSSDCGGAAASIEALFYLCVMQGRYHDGVRLFDDGQVHSDLAGYTHALLANCHVQTGDYERAERALHSARRCGAGGGLARAHCLQAEGNMHHVKGATKAAHASYMQAYDIRVAQGDALGAYYAIGAASWLALQQQDIARARELISLSARQCQRAGHLGGMIGLHSSVGDLARLEGRAEDAARSYQQAADIAEATNHPQMRAPLLLKLSALALEAGRQDDCMANLQDAQEAAQAVGDQRVTFNVLVEMGRQLRTLSDWSGARGKFRSALKVSRDLEAGPLTCVALSAWAQSELDAGEVGRARKLAAIALTFQCCDLQPSLAPLCSALGVSERIGQDEVEDALFEVLNEESFGLLRL